MAAMTREEHGRAREGRLTGSMAKRLMSGDYRTWNRLLQEIRSPRPFYDRDQGPPAIQWGHRYEPMAAALFWEAHPELNMHDPVFVPYHDPEDPLSRYVGVSPDRMISELGSGEQWVAGYEGKAPYSQERHWWTITNDVIPPEHYPQCCFGMLVAGLRRWWFTSFDPRLPEGDPDRLFEYQVAWDDDYMQRMEDLTREFVDVLSSGGEFRPQCATARRMQEMFP